jgi:hypothetical protein
MRSLWKRKTFSNVLEAGAREFVVVPASDLHRGVKPTSLLGD